MLQGTRGIKLKKKFNKKFFFKLVALTHRLGDCCRPAEMKQKDMIMI